MSRNDVLGVGAAASLLLFSGAWLTGYWDNRLLGWIGLVGAVAAAVGFAWYSRNSRFTQTDMARYAGGLAAIAFVVASLLGLIATRWAHGDWRPATEAPLASTFSQTFSQFPGGLMRSILYPTLPTVVLGAVLLALVATVIAAALPPTTASAKPSVVIRRDTKSSNKANRRTRR